MDKISTLLVPFDFSPLAEKALDYAVDFIGLKTNMRLILVHISESSESDSINARFEEIKLKHSKTLRSPIELINKNGSITDSVLEVQKSRQIDLIIMGTSAPSKSSITKSNTSELVKAANCPVLVVPNTIEDFQLKNIALVLGKDEINNKQALSTLLDVARKFNAKVHVLTIENEPGMYGYSSTDEKNENLLEYYLESFYQDHMFIENKDVVEGISNYVSEKAIDLISILPSNQENNTHSKGKLTEALTLQSKAPLLAIN
ncbi:universal stress protein [uncultured Maribacter sp.]|uniref:universal stress protein n=1 Tax=uncultured Maribacter sp. TaxID=431308 RepID=UPI002634DEE5|nr:universal stress protein [uncultured Maribacter sp.]